MGFKYLPCKLDTESISEVLWKKIKQFLLINATYSWSFFNDDENGHGVPWQFRFCSGCSPPRELGFKSGLQYPLQLALLYQGRQQWGCEQQGGCGQQGGCEQLYPCHPQGRLAGAPDPQGQPGPHLAATCGHVGREPMNGQSHSISLPAF